jgi:hypothetical protein
MGHEGLMLADEDSSDGVKDRVRALKDALKPLVAIADAYDSNNLDDEARKFWGPKSRDANERNPDDWTKQNTTHPEELELYSDRGGKRLLTLAHCLKARELVRGLK